MIMIINKDLEPLIASVVEKAITDSVPEVKAKLIEGLSKSGPEVHVVSRETFKLSEEEIDVMEELSRTITNECGQISCAECIMKAKKERFGSICLLNQLNEIRRRHS